MNAYYEDTAQELSQWKNVIVYGDAASLNANSEEYEKAVELISKRSEHSKRRVEVGLVDIKLFKIIPVRVKVLDFAVDPRLVSFDIGGDETGFEAENTAIVDLENRAI